MEKYSIQYFALDHHTHDDEMKGIRDITKEYSIPLSASTHLKVVFEELQALEKDLILHAKIEDEILFIKALQIEKQVKTKIATILPYN
jgi:regulator of cell morphogenesis and NO signaling